MADGARRRRARLGRALAAARRLAHDHRRAPRLSRCGRRRDRRRARAARHHRPAPRRSDPARLRRQRLARAADAADGDPRLRRGACRKATSTPDERRRFLDIIMRHTLRMERLVKDLLRLARLDAGQETLELASCDVRGARAVGGRRTSTPSLEARRQRVEIDDRPRRRDAAAAIRPSCTTCCSNLVANATHLRAGSTADPRRRVERLATARRHLGLGRRARHSGRGPVARLRALLPRGQVARARSGRHRSRAGDRQAPRRAARRRGARREPRPAAGRRFTIELPDSEGTEPDSAYSRAEQPQQPVGRRRRSRTPRESSAPRPRRSGRPRPTARPTGAASRRRRRSPR